MFLFKILDEAQSAHGIPNQDYNQYHAYCTNRLARIRHHRDVRSHFYSNNNNIKHEYILLELFFQAERCWAQACAANNNKHTYALRRLHKAVKWANQLEQLVQENNTNDTNESSNIILPLLSECQAYAAWMRANASLEQKQYVKAGQAYQQSLVTLLNLASNNNTDSIALQDLWTNRAESLLRPLVRYCQHEARDDPDLHLINVNISNNNNNNTTKQDLEQIKLHVAGQDVVLDNHPQLLVLYLKLQDYFDNRNNDAIISDEKTRTTVASDIQDALTLINNEQSHYANFASGPAVDAKRQELQLLHQFFNYHKLDLWRQQQEAQIVAIKDDDAAIVHVYDAIQQIVEQMINNNSEDEEEAQAHLLRIRAFRCYHLSKLLQDQPKQSLALLKHAQQLAKRAIEEVAACELPFLEKLEQLQDDISTMTVRVQASRYIQAHGSTTTASSSSLNNKPLWLRLDQLDAAGLTLDNPPLTIPMPCKPAFYDIAWQHIAHEYPTDVLEKYIKPKSGGGIFGWFSRG